MAKYVDGFVLAVPKDEVDAYRKLARKAAKLWKEYGALEYKECVAEDVPKGEVTSFPMSVKGEAERDGRIRLDHLQVTSAPGQGQQAGDGGSAHEGRWDGDAV